MGADSRRQLMGIVGCGLLFIGVFLPIVSAPIAGGINYFQNGHGDGTIVLLFAVLSAVFVARRKFEALWFTGTGAMGMLLFTFLTLYMRVSIMREEVEGSLAGNPFAELGYMAMQSVQMQWGWGVLCIGAAMLLTAAAWEQEQPRRAQIGKKLAVVAGVLMGVVGITYISNRAIIKSSPAVPGNAQADVKRETAEDVEAKAYLPKVKLYETWGGYSYGNVTCPEFEGRKCASFRAKMKNEGDRSLSTVEVTVYFPDKDGKRIFEKSYSPVLEGALMSEDSGPLKPGYIREFGYVVDDCPSECVPTNAHLEVTKVEFHKAPTE